MFAAFCLALPNPMTRDLILDHAGLRLASLAEMPLRSLLEQVILVSDKTG